MTQDSVSLGRAERVEATDKWFGVARHPIPYMKPGWYYIIPAERVEDDDR